MVLSDKDRFDLTRHWMQRADEDLAAAEDLAEGEPENRDGTGEKACLAVDGYLRAYLAWYRVEFSESHSLEDLLERVARIDDRLSRSLRRSAVLGGFVRESATGGENTMAAPDAVEQAKEVREEIRYALDDFLRMGEEHRLEAAPEGEDLVTVFASGSRIEIEIAEVLLREAGIECFTVGDEMQDLFALGRIGSGVNPVTGPTRIEVRTKDEADALSVLDEMERDEPES